MNNNVGLLHVRVPQITAKAVDAVRLGVLLRRTGVQTAVSFGTFSFPNRHALEYTRSSLATLDAKRKRWRNYLVQKEIQYLRSYAVLRESIFRMPFSTSLCYYLSE